MKEATSTAYMDTQDIAKFAINALSHPETINKTYDLAGPKAWFPDQIVALCEEYADEKAKITRMPIKLLRNGEKFARFFQWSWNIADRLMFSEVITANQPLSVPMEETYQAFGVDPAHIATLEAYLKEYFERILKKLKQLDLEQNQKQSRKRTPFKTPSS